MGVDPCAVVLWMRGIKEHLTTFWASWTDMVIPLQTPTQHQVGQVRWHSKLWILCHLLWWQRKRYPQGLPWNFKVISSLRSFHQHILDNARIMRVIMKRPDFELDNYLNYTEMIGEIIDKNHFYVTCTQNWKFSVSYQWCHTKTWEFVKTVLVTVFGKVDF